MTRPTRTPAAPDAARYAIALCVVLQALACRTPRDSDGTLDRVRHGTMRVGFVVMPPWVSDSAGRIGGVEPTLVTELASALGATIEWVPGPESQLLAALHHRELDIVIGGLTDESPWKGKVAFTRPYYTDSVVVGVPPGTSLTRLDGEAVAVEGGDPVAAVVRKRGARPVPVLELSSARGAVATSLWRVAALGRTSTGILLEERAHALAVPPGENAWLVRLESHLHDREGDIPRMLRSAAR